MTKRKTLFSNMIHIYMNVLNSITVVIVGLTVKCILDDIAIMIEAEYKLS